MRMVLRVGILGLFAAGMAGIGAAVGQSLVVDEVRTRALTIEDSEGRTRASLTTENGQATLSMNDKTGQTRVSLSASGEPDGACQLIVFDKDGTRAISVSVVDGVIPSVQLVGPNESKMGLFASNDATAVVMKADKLDRQIMLGMLSSGECSLEVSDSERRVHAQLQCSDDGSVITLVDPVFDSGAIIGAAGGNSSVILMGKDGMPYWNTPPSKP
eukprot:TRINITY_DN5055_c0_g1_i21.p2 TRINITY_DN5055_c0_g1~~TRINITY_DN5055_c0_g1_i21.p2  ORF type:complete len:215 (+),score=13.93 TRINITY_DN5055_c0_g1_i21:798-1442(+)